MTSLLSQRGGALRALRSATSSSASPTASSSKTTLAPSSSSSSPVSECVRHASTTTRLTLSVGTYKVNLDVNFALPSFLSRSDSTAQPPLALALDGGYAPACEETSSQQENPLEWDGFLNAVPKSKVSHSRKRMRSANKGLKDRVDLVHCAGCGAPKLLHHICGACYSDINKRQKMAFKPVRLEKLHEQKAQLLLNMSEIAKKLDTRKTRALYMIEKLNSRIEKQMISIMKMGGTMGAKADQQARALEQAQIDAKAAREAEQARALEQADMEARAAEAAQQAQSTQPQQQA